MATHARPLNVGDIGPLTPIDAAYARARGLQEAVSRASLHLYQRSGHSFVAQSGQGAVSGFVLAQAVWGGDSAVVSVQRFALADDGDLDAALALVKALTKSAYDSGVYHLELALPKRDAAARRAFEAEGFVELPSVVYARGLGSRAEQVERASAAAGGADVTGGVDA